MMCKQLLGVNKSTTNIAVLLELGLLPISFHAIKAAIKNWERIRLKEAHKYVISSHLQAVSKNLPWISNIRNLLQQNGLICLYLDTHEDKRPFIHKKLLQRLSDQFHQNSFTVLKDHQSKLRTYGLLKTEIGTENYLQQITDFKVRKCYTKFRLSDHTLNIEQGRHNGIEKSERFCPFCTNQVETEIHFLIQCQAYNSPREELFETLLKTRPSFNYYTPTEKFKYLLSEDLALSSAKYIHKCFQIRNFNLIPKAIPFNIFSLII